LELDPCGVSQRQFGYGALGMNVSCGIYCVFVVTGVLGMGACQVHSVYCGYEAFGLVVFAAFGMSVAFMGLWS